MFAEGPGSLITCPLMCLSFRVRKLGSIYFFLHKKIIHQIIFFSSNFWFGIVLSTMRRSSIMREPFFRRKLLNLITSSVRLMNTYRCSRWCVCHCMAFWMGFSTKRRITQIAMIRLCSVVYPHVYSWGWWFDSFETTLSAFEFLFKVPLLVLVQILWTRGLIFGMPTFRSSALIMCLIMALWLSWDRLANYLSQAMVTFMWFLSSVVKFVSS